MPLLVPTLAAGLAALPATDQESVALDAITRAWLDYVQGASVVGIPALRPVLDGLPRLVFQRTLSGVRDNTFATQLQAAIVAFWGACGPLASAIWIVPPPMIIVPGSLVPPLGNLVLAAQLSSDFATITSAKLPAAAAASITARTIGLAQLGAVIQTQVPPAVPVTQPIL